MLCGQRLVTRFTLNSCPRSVPAASCDTKKASSLPSAKTSGSELSITVSAWAAFSVSPRTKMSPLCPLFSMRSAKYQNAATISTTTSKAMMMRSVRFVIFTKNR